MVHNGDVRKLLIGLVTTLLALVIGAVGTDFGAAIVAEYRLSRAVREAADLNRDPSVAILGFPFIPQAARGHYDELEIKANGVTHPHVGQAALEATMHSIDLGDSSWLIPPEASLTVGTLESRIIIASGPLGSFMGLRDLMVEAPEPETNDPTGGTTESGISSNQGLVFTATPTAAGFDQKVSVSVDLSLTGPGQSTLVFTPTEILTGPGTADQDVPEDQQQAVLDVFRAELPDQRLPFGVAPTTQGARGSDVIIEGITDDITVHLDQFRPRVSEESGHGHG